MSITHTLILAVFVQGSCIGILHSVEKKVSKNCPILEKNEKCPNGNEITYWLSTSSTPDNQVQLDLKNLKDAPFIKGPLKIWFHGYTDHHESPIVKKVVQGYTSRGQYNVLVVDWNTYCKKACYLQAKQSMEAMGVCIGQFVSALLKAHTFENQVHLLGHSLGAHLASWTSINIPGVPRLTKLDPAMPLFTAKGSQRGLADLIDVYHSNCDIAGQKEPTGDVDVFFNTATFQPGCKCDISCSHARCVNYFLESIGKTMAAFPCKGWTSYAKNECPVPTEKDLVHVGEGIDSKIRGVFMAFTRNEPPFLEQKDAYVRPNIFESFKTILKKEECAVVQYASLAKEWMG